MEENPISQLTEGNRIVYVFKDILKILMRSELVYLIEGTTGKIEFNRKLVEYTRENMQFIKDNTVDKY